MHFFGYANHPTIQTPTQFVKYTDQTDAEIANYSEFLKLNKELIGNIGDEKSSPVQSWHVNGG